MERARETAATWDRYSKRVKSEERGCKGIPFLPRPRVGVVRAEVTRGKGRSVALCPLTGEFYSKCVYLLLI